MFVTNADHFAYGLTRSQEELTPVKQPLQQQQQRTAINSSSTQQQGAARSSKEKLKSTSDFRSSVP
jgi:hypothetical protein